MSFIPEARLVQDAQIRIVRQSIKYLEAERDWMGLDNLKQKRLDQDYKDLTELEREIES
jgi:hypothetical protein